MAMQNLILALSPTSHDCSYCLVDENGNVVIHCELERDIRIKQVKSSPLLYWLIDSSNDKYTYNISTISLTACPVNLPLYSVITKVANKPLSNQQLLDIVETLTSYSAALGEFSVTNENLEKFRALLENVKHIRIYGHHRCHAAEAWGCHNVSTITNALIITADGGGWDFDDGGILREAHMSVTTASSNTLNKTRYDWINSLGLTYLEATSYLGFSVGPPVGSQEGSVMGLAAYGNANNFASLFSSDNLWVNTSLQNTDRDSVFKERSICKKTIDLSISQGPETVKADIAASLQQEYEQRFNRLIVQEVNNYQRANSCLPAQILLSGGCALNCAAIGKLTEQFAASTKYKDVAIHVSLAPYDGGLSLGAAFCAVNDLGRFDRTEFLSPYLGREYSSLEIHNSIRGHKCTSEELDYDFIINSLARGGIAAIFRGRSESGRRALCNRSIIADPRNPNIRDIINTKVKHRPLFRPFAPVVLREHVHKWFIVDIESRYMSHAIQFRNEVRSVVPSVVHKDGTGRLQTIDYKTNKWMYELLVRWNNLTGVPMLINTSFNDNEPIVETPFNAISCFERTLIDILLFPDVNSMLLRTSLANASHK